MNLLEEFIKVKTEYVRMINENGLEIIADFILQLHKDEEKFNAVYITGSTPSWNDGEPCEHSTYVYLDDEIFESIDFEFPEDFEANNMPRVMQRELENKINFVDEILHELYGTNYYFWAVIVDGKVTIDHGEYDCGY